MRNLVLIMLLSLMTAVAQAEWDPTPPEPDEWDWVQLTSGEWLKGEIIALYNHELEFDSDELDTLMLDIEDIKRIRSGKPVDLMLSGKKRLKGQLVLDGGSFSLKGSDESYKVAEILTVTADSEEEASKWSIKYSLGANISSGNTNKVDVNSSLKMRRRSITNRLVFDYMANLSETEDEVTAKNHRVSAAWDFFLTERMFIRPIFAEYLKDPFQNLDYKYTIGSGVGYQLVDNSIVEWSVVGGPAYLMTHFVEVAPDVDDTEDSAAFAGATNFDLEVSSDIDYFFDYNFTLFSEDAGKYSHHMVTGLEIELSKFFDLDISFVWDRTENPAENAEGIAPEKDDYRVIVGLGFEY